MVTYSGERTVGGQPMALAELGGAAVQQSDNGSANALMRVLGGPSMITAFARMNRMCRIGAS